MEDKLYECIDCGKKWKKSELIARGENYVNCPECHYRWFEEGFEKPSPELKVVPKSKKK